MEYGSTWSTLENRTRVICRNGKTNIHLIVCQKLFWWFCRSSSPEAFSKKDVLKNFAKFTGRHLCQTVCSCHVTYAFQSESALYSGLNIKELLVRSRREIRNLSDCNWTRTQIHLVRKRTRNHLVKVVDCLFTN